MFLLLQMGGFGQAKVSDQRFSHFVPPSPVIYDRSLITGVLCSIFTTKGNRFHLVKPVKHVAIFAMLWQGLTGDLYKTGRRLQSGI